MATLLEDFDNISEWTLGGSASSGIAEDEQFVWQSTKSLRFTLNNTTQNRTATKSVSWDLSAVDGILFVAYVHYTKSPETMGLTLYLSNDASAFTNSFSFTINKSFNVGWNVFYLKKTDFSAAGTATWASAIQYFRVTITGKANLLRDVSIDSMWTPPFDYRPKIALTFDDGHETHETASAYANSVGVPMTHFIIPDLIGETNYLTSAGLQTLSARGDAICVHDTVTWDTETNAGRIKSVKKALSDLGFISNHGSAPEGKFGQADGLFATDAKLTALRSVLLSVRGTQTGFVHPAKELATLYGTMRAHPLNNTSTLAQAQTFVDDCIATGCHGVFYGHKLGTADSLTWTQADFESLCDYIASKSAQIDAVTIPELYRTIMGEINAFPSPPGGLTFSLSGSLTING